MTISRADTSRAARESVRNPWLGVELRHLAALAAIVHEGSFRGAADSLGYVQSAVSQQLAHLERERGTTVVVLTPAGELLLEHAERILADLGAAHADLEELEEGGSGHLRMGACTSLAAGILPRILPRVHRKAPKLRLEATEAPAPVLAAQVAGGTLDAAFAELPLPDGPFDSTRICADPYLLLAHPDTLRGGLDAEQVVDAAMLAELPLIDHSLMEPVEPLLRAAGVTPSYALSCESLASLRTLVAAGAGCAIVPGLLGASPGEDVLELRLDALLPPRQICVFRHSGRLGTPAIDLLVELAKWICGPLGPDAQPAGIGWGRPHATTPPAQPDRALRTAS